MKTAANDIDAIKEMLHRLSEEGIAEVKNFTAFLIERERKRNAFVQRVLRAEQEIPIRFDSVEEAMKAIIDESKKA